MSEVPSELIYSSSHEWVRVEGDEAIIGITAHAQELLGDLVFVELPEVGGMLVAGDEFAVVESVKAASDVYAPISGEVIAVNELLETAPETINHSPYIDGWLVKLRIETLAELDELLTPTAYAELTTEEG